MKEKMPNREMSIPSTMDIRPKEGMLKRIIIPEMMSVMPIMHE